MTESRAPSRWWIFDGDDTPQGFPLGQLVRAARAEAGSEHTCSVLRASGYGLSVNALDSELDRADSVRLSLSSLESLSMGVEEWFYELEVELPASSIKFGLHDSTALFVEAEPAIGERIVAGFSDVRLSRE